MHIKDKLRYIREGYCFHDIISGNFVQLVNDFRDEDMGTVFIETFITDMKYIIEVGAGVGHSLIDYIKRIIKWLRDKIIQFIRFIKNKFSNIKKDSKETVKKANKVIQNAKKENRETTMSKSKRMTLIDKPSSYRKSIVKRDEPHEYANDYIVHNSGAMEYVPDIHEITLFSHIMTKDNFFEEGFMKVYEVLHDYIEHLESNPTNHERILPANQISDKREFLDKVFRKALSVPYDKKEIFKKIYGDVESKVATTRILIDLTNKLESIDDECQTFANWIQNKLPDSLDKVQRIFEAHINKVQGKINSNGYEDMEYGRTLIDDLNMCLSKIIKLFELEMSVIQIFATMHAEVFMHLKAEVDNLNWVFSQSENDEYYQDNYYDYDDENGYIH